MNKLSTGADSTLENWIALSAAVFGKDSEPTKFLKEKAASAPHGVKEEVIANEEQLLQMLASMWRRK